MCHIRLLARHTRTDCQVTPTKPVTFDAELTDRRCRWRSAVQHAGWHGGIYNSINSRFSGIALQVDSIDIIDVVTRCAVNRSTAGEEYDGIRRSVTRIANGDVG